MVEAEFLKVNHCVTTEDDFGIVTKHIAKPTADDKSHHQNATFKSIFYGKTKSTQPQERRLPYHPVPS